MFIAPSAPGAAGGLTIGSLSRSVGIPMATLRTWERRYGFPRPQRRGSGHRVYAMEVVSRLRKVARALAGGHRASQVVAASERDLDQLIAGASPPAAPALPAAAGPADTRTLLGCVERLDDRLLTQLLLVEWGRRGVVPFLEDVVSPLLRAVGQAWAARRLTVAHEHFLAERMQGLLRALRLPLETAASGPLAVLATLPGEEHSLGLQMAALVLAAAGWRVLNLGTEVPLRDLAHLGRSARARVVGVCVSAATARGASRRLRALRAALPRTVGVLAGGEGAPPARPGVASMPSLLALDAWARKSGAAAL